MPRPPRSTLFPYTTLFRSDPVVLRALHHHGRRLVDSVGRRLLAVDVRVQHRDRELVGQRGHLADQRDRLGVLLAPQLGGEHGEPDRSADSLELLAYRLLVAWLEKGHEPSIPAYPGAPRTISSIRR